MMDGVRDFSRRLRDQQERVFSLDKPLNLAARLRDRLGVTLGELDPSLFVAKKTLVLDASRAAFYESEAPHPVPLPARRGEGNGS